MTSRALVALRIAAPPNRVFMAFTAEIGQWWRPHGLFELNGRRDGRLSIEAGVGGRVVESYPDGAQFEVGHVRVWDPPERLVLSWRAASFPPDHETEVHVRFQDVAGGTRVVVEHLGWDGLPREHVARHGFPLLPFQQRLAEWWQALLDSLADRVQPTLTCRQASNLEQNARMETDGRQQIDWLDWLQRWDAQQEGYVPEREARFTAMFDALAALLPASFVALDLAGGPGSISQRLLARFPRARAIAVDIDPVMLALGRGALGTFDGRLRWIDADLASPDWLEAVGETQVDAVLSTTALHWLEPEPLTRLYRDLACLLRPGGLILNGDHMAFNPALPTLAHLSQRVLDEQWTDAAFAARGIETAEQWWYALAAEPALEPLLTERTRRFAGKQRQEVPPGFDLHVAALRDAGFREVGTIWQVLSNRVLLAVR